MLAGLDFLTSARNSLRFFTGTLGCTTSTSGTDEIQLTGTRSFSGSNLMRFEYSVMLTASEAVVNRMVYPSAGDFAATSAPIRPDAPERFSTRKFWPMLCWNFWPSSRPWMSVPPPAPKGTMMRTGFVG